MDSISLFAEYYAAILGEAAGTIPYRKYIDFHTHRPSSAKDVFSIVNDGALSLAGKPYGTAHTENEYTRLSVGIHPWQVDADWRKNAPYFAAAARSPFVTTIGECGIDKARGGEISHQKEAFSFHVQLSEEIHKPLVIHCVRAIDEIIAMRRGTHQPWILHGFRGKPQQLQQLLRHGIHVSLGPLFNPDTLHYLLDTNTPFLLETDDSGMDIREVYRKIGHTP